MVKVKGRMVKKRRRTRCGFNHPMVKVKVSCISLGSCVMQSFNHPMVKVKDRDCNYSYITA